jgi:glycosyltransferase involved in cell wall biosynthesis
MLGALEHHYGPLRSTAVVPNGRRATSFRPARKEPIVLAAGRLWDEGKNMAAVDEIAGLVPWPVVLAGDVRPPSGAPSHVTNAMAIGRLSTAELSAWMGRAALFVLPARYEPFGLGPLEAALAGCALILGDIPSLRETWERCALFVPPDDVGGLAAAVNALIADETRRRSLAAAARARALELTPERMAAGYMRVYRDSLASRSLGRSEARP